MALVAGTRFGSYEIVERIGSGGMGEVWRATDTNLKRDVAVKALPEPFATDTERLGRFRREAELLASLNHPNIATIYGLEQSDGQTVIVMELVEGPTLEERIAAGPIPLEDALEIARQVADALEAAHGAHVVHRDLKPANIKLKPDGTIKVLDFGIAKAIDAQAISGGRSPVMTTPAATETGVILGTAAYMSPEQARGKLVDQRTDIWAFGCLLFEMLTGQPAFGGEDVMLTLARVLDRDTDMSGMPRTLSPAVRHTIKLCLEKDPRKRIADIRDVRLALAGAFALPQPPASAASTHGSVRHRVVPVVAGVLATAAVIVAAAWTLWPAAPRVTRFAYALPAGQAIGAASRPVLAVSPDGRSFVYSTDDGLYLRALDALEARLIPGTQALSGTPAFSPDGQSIAYVEWGPEQGRRPDGSPLADRVLRRISISGGAPVTIANVDRAPSDLRVGPYRIAWETDGTLLFDTAAGILRISDNGGTPQVIVDPGGSVVHSPELLPDGDTLLFTAATAGAPEGQIVAQSLSTDEAKVLIPQGRDPRYLPGRLVYASGETLFGIAFDAASLTVSGEAVPLVQGVMPTSPPVPSANYDVSESGTLVYVTGEAVLPRRELVWVDREGREEAIEAPPRNYSSAQLAPDGARIALAIQDREDDIWVWDLARRTLQRLTVEPGLNRAPVWSPDGQRIAFTRPQANTEAIYWQAVDGSGAPEPLVEVAGRQFIPSDFLPDGSALLYTEAPPRDIWLAPTDDPSAGRVLLGTAANETNTAISPDGNWIAFQSDESGRIEVYVRPFPGVATGRWQVSTEGGTRPHWSPDGTELFYYIPRADGSGAMVAVPIDSSASFSAGSPQLLFQGSYVAPNPGRQTYDVSPDGRRFLMIKSMATGAVEEPRVVVVENWLEELERLVPID